MTQKENKESSKIGASVELKMEPNERKAKKRYLNTFGV